MSTHYGLLISECIISVDKACKEIIQLKKNADPELLEWSAKILKQMNTPDLGYCAKYDKVISKYRKECIIGMVRKDRDRVILTDSTCESCPLFIQREIFTAIVNNSEKDLRRTLFKRSVKLFIAPELAKNQV